MMLKAILVIRSPRISISLLPRMNNDCTRTGLTHSSPKTHNSLPHDSQVRHHTLLPLSPQKEEKMNNKNKDSFQGSEFYDDCFVHSITIPLSKPDLSLC
jgi:hypothetical protein